MRFLKNTLAVVAGCITAMILISVSEALMTHAYPFPPGTNINNRESLRQAMHNMPQGSYNMLLIGYAVGAFAAGIVATLISKRTQKNPAIVCGIILTILGIVNAVQFQHPTWFCTANIISLLCAYIGYLVARRKVIVVL